ncbi:MAG: type I toxin-antitoxin system SymE family toxin [Desulfobacterales bacterium]|nr:type I toxin-antitoxin system SymE family toxin [Desulfobacterales bacterium]
MVKERTLKVADCPWRSSSASPASGRYPGLRIGGKWLQDCGFDNGDFVRVVCETDNLKIIKMELSGKEVISVDHAEIMTFDCEKKHSVRYKGNGEEKSLKLIYVPKSLLTNPYPKTVRITLTAGPK